MHKPLKHKKRHILEINYAYIYIPSRLRNYRNIIFAIRVAESM